FTEDWRLAGGRPSDRPANAVNAGNANPIVFGDIRIGQALYWLRNEYPTVISEKRNLVYGSLAQGGEPIGDFYSKLLKYGKMLNLNEQQIKGQFLRGLSPDLEDDAERIGTEQPLADLFEILERIEMRRAEKKLGLVTPQQIQPSQPLQTPQPYYGPQPPGTYQKMQDILMDRFVQWITGEVSEFVPISKPDLPPKPVIKKVEVDSDNELANLTKKQLKLHVAKAVKKATKAQHRCSNCNRTGHNSRKCPRKKKSRSKNKKGNVHKVTIDSSSESNSDTNSSDNNSDSGSESGSNFEESSAESESESDIKVYISKKAKLRAGNPFKPCKRDQKETPNSGKSRNKSTIIDKSLQRVVLDMLDGIAPVDWIEKLKAKIGTNMPAHVETPEIPDSDDEFIDDPMEIDFFHRKDPATDVVTTKCKIKRLVIPAATVDPGANFAIMSEDIAKRLKLVIDTKDKHDLR
ncbi:hypothetical protein C2G38_2236365, partial [Gigaspora rosea]